MSVKFFILVTFNLDRYLNLLFCGERKFVLSFNKRTVITLSSSVLIKVCFEERMQFIISYSTSVDF